MNLKDIFHRSTVVISLATVLSIISLVSCSRGTRPLEGTDPMVTEALSKISEDSLYVYIDKLVSFHTRHTLSSKTDPERGIGATVRWIAEKAQQWGDASNCRPKPIIEPVLYHVGGPGSRYDRETDVPQIMVTYPGTDGSREIVIMAMIDTRVADINDSTSFAPGADDNGSGTAFLLEACRILSETPLRQTVRCLFVSGEEQGLDGSAYFAKVAREQKWPIIAVLNDDMIGNTISSETNLVAKDKVRVFSESRSGEDSDNRQLARYVKESAAKYVPGHEVVLVYRNDRYMRGGDHSSFIAEGFTAVRVCEYYENYDMTHQYVHEENGISYGDVLSRVDIPYVAANSRVTLSSVLELAQAPARPEGVRIANARALSNYSILSWRPVEEDGVSYEVLYRETDKSTWEIYHRLTEEESVVENGVISYSLPISKDNFFFAVRSVSSDGHPSLPAFCR